MGDLPDTLPLFLWPEVPLTFETLQIIFPYAAALAVVASQRPARPWEYTKATR
jgi:MFS superfamily sulfate permease-like transporter